MQRPGVEFRVAIAGPIASFLLAVVAFLLALPTRGSNASAQAALDYLAVANLLLGGFNLIPGFPLEGGRIPRSIIWKVTGISKSRRTLSILPLSATVQQGHSIFSSADAMFVMGRGGPGSPQSFVISSTATVMSTPGQRCLRRRRRVRN